MDRPGDRGAAEDAQQFVEKWSRAELTERAASHEHFLDLCRLLGQPTPAAEDGRECHAVESGSQVQR